MALEKKAGDTAPTNTIHFNPGTILHDVRGDKYTQEVKESFIIEAKDTGAKYKIKRESMLELAELDTTKEEYSLLLNNGWEASGKMSAGTGKAVKIHRTDTAYKCIFYEGEMGKAFDPNKIQSKHYIALDKEHVSAIFTFLRCNKKVSDAKDAARKIERTTLDLG